MNTCSLVDLSEAEYHKVADHTLEDLSERIEVCLGSVRASLLTHFHWCLDP